MPVEADAGRARSLGFEISFRLLASGFDIATDSAAVASALAFIIPAAKQDLPLIGTHRYEVRRSGERYEIAEDGVGVDHERCPEFVMHWISRRTKRIALETWGDSVMVHGGLGLHRGRRFLLAGARFAGKTTLMARLLYAGAAVEGDEMVLLRDGAATAFPRPFHMREDSLALLPELADRMADTPYLVDERDRRIYGFDPAKAGFDWRIRSGPLDSIFFLEQNHGGQTRLVPMPKVEMVQQLMQQCLLPAAGQGRWVAEIAAAVERSRTFLLYNGDVRQTAAAILSHL